MAPITSFAMLAGFPGNHLGLDLLRDLAPVGTIGAMPIVVVAAARLPVQQGVEVAPGDAAATRGQLAGEMQRWAQVIRDARIALQ